MVMRSHEIAPSAVREGASAELPANDGGLVEIRGYRSHQWAQAAILVMLFTAPAAISLRMASVADPDIWWHLRSAEWIAANHALPRTDPFSTFGAGKPWAAYSWLYELMVYGLYRWLGLQGIVAYTAGMAVAVAMALHRLLGHLQRDFTFAVLLTIFSVFSIMRLYTPRPWLFSILLFTLVVDLLMRARRNGEERGLLWLPVIFALWANLHIQFVDGLVVLGIATAEAFAARRWSVVETRIRPGVLSLVTCSCVLATLVNPYGWKIYEIAYRQMALPGALDYLTELSALSFRREDDWCVLLLVIAAACVLARARRVALFETALLAFAIFVSFRSQRDIWVGVVAASVIVAAGVKGSEENRLRLAIFAAPLLVICVGVAVWTGFRVLRVNNARLSDKLAAELPVRAVETVKEKGWNGPLYNDYNWGGYLMWALRMPVSMDGRAYVYGDERIERFAATWNGRPDWQSDPELAKAGMVIAPVAAPLTQLLRLDSRFQLTYEDKLAAIFVARKEMSSAAAPAPKATVGSGHDAAK